jgi:lipoprotein-releasing system permease protein
MADDQKRDPTKPFSPFEWILAGRYLRTRRREGFVSVIAGFSFIGIMLGVATLIIVLSVMNGFRKELLDKIVGINGHIFVAPIERPLTDYADLADRLSKIPGIRRAVPMVEGQARLVALQGSGVGRARRARVATRRAIAGTAAGHARELRGGASPSAAPRESLSLQVGDTSPDHARGARRPSDRAAIKAIPYAAVSRSACRVRRHLRFTCRSSRRRPYFQPRRAT